MMTAVSPQLIPARVFVNVVVVDKSFGLVIRNVKLESKGEYSRLVPILGIASESISTVLDREHIINMAQGLKK